MKKLLLSIIIFCFWSCTASLQNSTIHTDKFINSKIIDYMHKNYNSNSIYEGLLQYEKSEKVNYIALFSTDNGYNKGIDLTQITFNIKNNLVNVIKEPTIIKGLPNRYTSTLRSFSIIEYGKHKDDSSNNGFQITYQWGSITQLLLLYQREQDELKEILDVFYSIDNTTYWDNCHLHYNYQPEIKDIVYESLCRFYPSNYSDLDTSTYKYYKSNYLYADSGKSFKEDWGDDIIQFQGSNSKWPDLQEILIKTSEYDEINKWIPKDEYKMFMDSLMTEMSQLTIPQYGTQLNDNSSKSLIERKLKFHHTWDCEKTMGTGLPNVQCEITSGSLKIETADKEFNDISITYNDEVLGIKSKKTFIYKDGVYKENLDLE